MQNRGETRNKAKGTLNNNAHEQALKKAYNKARAALDKKSTTDNIKAVEAARRALEAYRAEKAADADPEARRFANLLDVLGYLTDEGWKVSKTKLYADRGKIEKEKDGAYAKKAVDEYARRWLEKLDGSDQSEPGMAAKVKVETDIAREKLKALQRENEIAAGKWVLKSDTESMLAGRAALLKSGLGEEFIHARAARIIELVGGDQSRAPDLIELWLREMEDHFNRYSEPMEFAAPAGGVRDEGDE